jgi:hypothetical protein
LPERAQLRAFAADKLPDYMIPSRFVELPALPLTANGKIDRKALPRPEAESVPARAEVASTRAASNTEGALLKIFSDVLKMESVGPTDSLLDLGADSLQIFQIASRANLAGFSFTPREILQHRTVEKLCQTHNVTANKMTAARKPLQRVDRERYRIKSKH